MRVKLVDYLGIIPAYAGSTLQGTSRLGCSRDHPRVCGEHCATCPTGGSCGGSSPRMRGAPEKKERLVSDEGIIPAYAGSTRDVIRIP